MPRGASGEGGGGGDKSGVGKGGGEAAEPTHPRGTPHPSGAGGEGPRGCHLPGRSAPRVPAVALPLARGTCRGTRVGDVTGGAPLKPEDNKPGREWPGAAVAAARGGQQPPAPGQRGRAGGAPPPPPSFFSSASDPRRPPHVRARGEARPEPRGERRLRGSLLLLLLPPPRRRPHIFLYIFLTPIIFNCLFYLLRRGRRMKRGGGGRGTRRAAAAAAATGGAERSAHFCKVGTRGASAAAFCVSVALFQNDRN